MDEQPQGDERTRQTQRTAVRPLAEATAPRPHNDGRGADGGRRVGELLSRARSLVGRHRAAALATLALVAVAAALGVISLVRAAGVPDDKVVEADARRAVESPAYSPGDFGPDDVLVARSAQVLSCERSSAAPDGSEALPDAAGYASARVVVSYSGNSVAADKGVTLGYGLVDGSWERVGSEADVQVSWHALAGVDQDKVVRNVGILLSRAETALDGDGAEGEPTLSDIYADAKAEVTSESFDEDAQTDTLVVRCEKGSSYESYVCELTVTFSFRPASGQWAVSEIEVSPDAKSRTFGPLRGDWTGTFQSQRTDGTKCLAARGTNLRLTITGDETSGGTTRITGTVSGLAHYHEHPASDAESTDGDAPFDDVPFTATLVGGHNEDTDSDLAFIATLPEDVGGTVTITLGFGVSGDPSQAVAVVQTTFPHTGSFLFIPYDETITYSDTFTLTRD